MQNSIDFKIDKSKKEGVIFDNDIFPSHFLCIVCGPPGKLLYIYIRKRKNLIYKVYTLLYI
jgi:hypothetical protein